MLLTTSFVLSTLFCAVSFILSSSDIAVLLVFGLGRSGGLLLHELEVTHGRGFGWREVVALAAVATQLDEAEPLHVGLYTFGGDGHAERMRHVDGRGDDRIVGCALAEAGDERLVDLELVERVTPEIRERRPAGTEVVDRQSDADGP